MLELLLQMARQRKSPTGEVRDKHITVWVSESERAYLVDRSGSLSMSEYLLQAGLGQTIPQRRSRPRVPEINRLIYLELSRISNNLNQIAKACNIAIQTNQSCKIDLTTIAQLNTQIKEIRTAVMAIDPSHEDESE
ncbi:MobC family plasmid mobilization relaxosome protein [Phormidesmis sp. 146-12]